MKTASAAKMAAQFNEFLDASREQPVLVTRNGKPVAVLLPSKTRRKPSNLRWVVSVHCAPFFRKLTSDFRRMVEFPTLSFGGMSSNHDASNDRHHRAARKPNACSGLVCGSLPLRFSVLVVHGFVSSCRTNR